MKIVHVICSLCTGGAELMLIDILKHQAQMGHDVSLVVVNRQYESSLVSRVPEKVKTVFVNRPEGSRNPLWIAKFNYELLKLRPEIVHFHHDKAAGMCFRPLVKAKTVATVHDTKINLNYYLRLDEVCSISAAVKADLSDRYNIDSPIVYNGVEAEAIRRKACAGRTEKIKMIQISRLNHHKKGQDLIIGAVAELIKSGYDITLDFIGEGESDQYLKSQAADLGISDAVKFLGLKDRTYIYEHLCDYDILLQPSRYEGFGLTVAEAMLAKVPVVVSNIEGPMEVIGNGRYGRSFVCGDVDDLVRTLKSVLENFDAVRQIAENDAYQHALSSFDIAQTAARYVERYAKLLAH